MAERPSNGEKTVQGRDEKGRFTSGNKGGGRPRVPEELRSAFQKFSSDALDVLVEIMSSPGAKDADRIRAAEVILDRGWGKAPQSVDLETGGTLRLELIDEILRDGE